MFNNEIPHYAKHPVPGRGIKPYNPALKIEISFEDIPGWNAKKLIVNPLSKFRDHVIFVNDKHEEVMQSLRAIRFFRCKPGEENCNAKLTNNESIQIFERANKGEDCKLLAKEFEVSEDTVLDIKNLRARIGVTLDHLYGETKEKPAKATIAKRKKHHKLSLQLANFIRKDKKVMRMDIAALAKKYCVHKRTIQKILNNEMYKI